MDILKFVSGKIREHTGRTPEDEEPPDEIPVGPAVVKSKECKELNDPMADRDAIASIEPVYKEESFDAIRYELERLPKEVNLEMIDQDRIRMERQLSAVSRKVSELVLENHPAYEVELNRVMELQQNLKKGSVVCSNGRKHLERAKVRFTTASLGLLANYRKRQQLYALLKTLRTIHTLQRTDIRLREMLEEEDYPGAIQLCLECQKAASTFRHYRCISELSSKLQDTLEMIEESLDVALSKTCNKFDEKHYEKVQTAYRLLGKTQTAMDQLHMHFTTAIHYTAFTKVLGYVELCSGTGDSNFQKRQYYDLCKNISAEMFTPCLVDLCKALWEVMKSYHKTIQWHERYEKEAVAEAEGNGNSMEANINRRHIKRKLDHGLIRIWGDVQQKLKVYLLSTDLSDFKYDEFIQVLDIVNRLIQIGEEFCGSKSEGLEDSIQKQSINYFRSYHWTRMGELRMFLENEAWGICPVKQSFSILHLQEFKFLRSQQHGENDSESLDSPEEQTGPYGYFDKYEFGSPFDTPVDDDEMEDVMDSSSELQKNGQPGSGGESGGEDDGEDEEDTSPRRKAARAKSLRRMSANKLGKPAPIITNTTLNVLRLFGKYMQMMSVLKPIALEVITCMSQLFDYYLYTVYSFFASETDAEDNQTMSTKLRTTLQRIRGKLISEDEQLLNQQQPGSEEKRDKFAHPHMPSFVNLTSGNNLYGLAERVVATESLVFLAEQLEFLRKNLNAMIPSSKIAFLQQFFSQTVSTAPELRKPVYRTVATRAINYDHVLQLMSAVRWDIRDIVSQHSEYVNVLLKEMTIFSQRLARVATQVPIPQPVSHVIWEHCIHLATRTFVEGFSQAKKCTIEGRSLMQVDFESFIKKLQDITDIRPIPDRDYVDDYVKAYYFPEQQLEQFIRDHREYSSKQVIALLNCVSHINKRTRTRLVGMVDEFDKTRR